MKKVTLFITMFILMSCGFVGINKIRNFNVYKENIIEDNDIIPFKTKGIYISLGETTFPFVFYNNGAFKNIRYWQDSLFWNSPTENINKIERDWEYNTKESFGSFMIKNDTLIIQEFNRNNQEFYNRNIIEQKGIILNDSTIKIISEYSYSSKEQFIKKPVILRFYATDKKPDSTKAWFVNKKWYRKKLHESRQ